MKNICRRYNYTILSVLFYFLLINTSCSTSMFYTTIDILRPADIEFKTDANKLLIINNAAPQPDSIGHVMKYYNGLSETISIPVDSVPFYCLSFLTDEIQETEFFASVKLISPTVNTNHDFKQIIPLQYKSINELARMYDSDVILSLDYMFVSDVMEEYDLSGGYYYAVLQANYESLWSIHYPNTIEVTPVHFKDTLIWDSDEYTRGARLINSPDRRESLIDGAVQIGLNSVERFIPYWEEADRYFFHYNNKNMKNAMNCVYEKEWLCAIEYWNMNMNRVKNKIFKGKIANNIAIAYEILGDYENALIYIQYALDFLESNPFFDYIKIDELRRYKFQLEGREKEIEKLNKQLGN